MKKDHMLGTQAFDKLSEEIDYIRRIAANAQDVRVRTRAAFNLERVRSYYEDHPGCTQKHVCRALNLTTTQVQTAVQKLRNQWKDR